MTTLLKNKKITLAFIIGAILLLAGLIIWLYTDSIIQNLQQTLQNTNLTQQQRWQTQGSLEWWTNTKTTLYDPTAITLITTGLIALLYVTLWAIIQPTTQTNPTQNPKPQPKPNQQPQTQTSTNTTANHYSNNRTP
jgi:hypothetical protein